MRACHAQRSSPSSPSPRFPSPSAASARPLRKPSTAPSAGDIAIVGATVVPMDRDGALAGPHRAGARRPHRRGRAGRRGRHRAARPSSTARASGCCPGSPTCTSTSGARATSACSSLERRHHGAQPVRLARAPHVARRDRARASSTGPTARHRRPDHRRRSADLAGQRGRDRRRTRRAPRCARRRRPATTGSRSTTALSAEAYDAILDEAKRSRHAGRRPRARRRSASSTALASRPALDRAPRRLRAVLRRAAGRATHRRARPAKSGSGTARRWS